MLRLTGTLAADAEVVVPDNRKPYFVHNATAGGFAVTVRTAAGAGVVVGASPDNTAVVYCDGTDVLAISAGTAGGGGGAGALIELGDTDIALRSIAVALANPDAEAGDTSGWTTTGTWEAGTAEGTIAAPHGGSFYFSATDGTDPAILEQTVDLIAQGFTAAELDAGATFDAGVWAASEYQSDTGELKLQFLDAAGADVGSVFTTGEFGPNDGTWVEQTLTGDVPAGARQVRVQLLAHNHFGSNTTYGFDDLVAQPLGPPAGDGRPPALRRQRLGRRHRGGGPGRCRPRRSRRRRCQRHHRRLRADPRGGRQLRPPCRRRRQRLHQGVRRRLRRRRHLHALPGTPGHGAGLGRWPARDRLQRRRRHAHLRHGTANGATIVAWDIGGGGTPYDIGVYFPGQPEAGATLLQLVATRAFTLPADLTGSQGYAAAAPTAQADLDIQKNGASIGTVTFGASDNAATFVFASEITFAAGDRLTVLAPGSQDVSLADVSLTFKGTRA